MLVDRTQWCRRSLRSMKKRSEASKNGTRLCDLLVRELYGSPLDTIVRAQVPFVAISCHLETPPLKTLFQPPSLAMPKTNLCCRTQLPKITGMMTLQLPFLPVRCSYHIFGRMTISEECFPLKSSRHSPHSMGPLSNQRIVLETSTTPFGLLCTAESRILCRLSDLFHSSKPVRTMDSPKSRHSRWSPRGLLLSYITSQF